MRDGTRMVFIHPSDELYGADRILLDLFQTLTPNERARSEFWLPTDVPHGQRTLCAELEGLGATVRHVDLPILRRTYRSPRALLRLVARAAATFRLLRGTRPQLVYLTTSATYLCAPVARSAGIRRVVGHKQELWSRSDSRVLAPCARACHQLITISTAVRDNLPESLRRRAVVVLNATRDPGQRQSLVGRTGPLTFVVASRWNAWKGHRTLLAAWDRADSPGKLVVLGGPPPSGEAVDVVSSVAALQRPESVTIVGEVADAGPHLEAADVVVVPSDDPEPFGLVAIEAFARGRPVIGSAAGGLAEVITDGLDGWTFPPRDVAALARLIGLLQRPQVEAAAAAARATYEARFTADRFAHDWRRAVGSSLALNEGDGLGCG
jgi:glycosyltransferase involved in cell wall biosynthesis